MKVLIVSCGNYSSQGYGCPGEWKCLTAAAKKEGNFSDYNSAQVVGFLECACNGRQLIPNIGCVKKNTDFDVIHFSTCMIKPWPACPHMDMDQLANKIEETFKVKVVRGTHSYA